MPICCRILKGDDIQGEGVFKGNPKDLYGKIRGTLRELLGKIRGITTPPLKNPMNLEPWHLNSAAGIPCCVRDQMLRATGATCRWFEWSRWSRGKKVNKKVDLYVCCWDQVLELLFSICLHHGVVSPIYWGVKTFMFHGFEVQGHVLFNDSPKWRSLRSLNPRFRVTTCG